MWILTGKLLEDTVLCEKKGETKNSLKIEMTEDKKRKKKK